MEYVKNADLKNEIIKCKCNDELSNAALKMLSLMARKFSLNYSYYYEEDREDCISVAVIDCWKYWRGYNPVMSENAFAYFSTIIHNGMKKQWNILYKNLPKSHKVSLSDNKIYSI